ncbi:hypothetical protein HFD88_010099 [Aspergillus terreus]|nr:hypothetical protein HFD88_010099 [Aspergillus terreus]
MTGHSHPVISLYYPQVLTLRQYLLQQIPVSSKSRRRRIASVRADGSDTETEGDHGLANLLDRTLVGVSKESPPTSTPENRRELARFSQSQSRSVEDSNVGPVCAQTEIVDFVISALFNRSGIAALYRNDNVEALKRSPWTDVLSLLGDNGDEIMLRLLFDCGIFVAIDEREGIYYQLSGLPLSTLEPVPKNVAQGNGPGSKTVVFPSIQRGPSAPVGGCIPAKVKNSIPGRRETLQKPNSIVFFRRRMLYARPAVNSKGDVQFGLTSRHVLNRYPSSSSLPDTLHVLKYIFPRQFGLHNVFTSVPNSRETSLPVKDYFSREEEIANAAKQRGSNKIPKRLRGGIIELVQHLQNRHKHCSYGELLRYYCAPKSDGPWKFGPVVSQPENPEELPLGSEPLTTQLRPFNETRTLLPKDTGYTQDQNFSVFPEVTDGSTVISSSRKISLTDYATRPSAVSAFCRAVLRKLIPPQFYGTGRDKTCNRDILMKHVDRFVRMRRFESLSIHEVCKGIKVACMSWLEPPGVARQNASSPGKLSRTDLQKRTELLHEIIYYIFDSILIPLIRTNFYVTESQTHRNRIFYFRHDVWNQLTQQPLSNLKATMFEELKSDKAKHILHQRALGHGSLRLLPKTTGIRPILNLRRRTIMKSKWVGRTNRFLGPSVNSTVAPIYNVLNYEKLHNPAQMGSCVSSMGDIQKRVKEFKRQLPSCNVPFYFVKLDIQSCFDTIPQQSLVRFIERVITQGAYHMTKYVEMRPPNEFGGPWSANQQQKNKATRKFIGRAAPTGKPEHLREVIAAGGTGRRRNTVFVDTPALKEYTAEDLLDLLNEHVSNNLVRFGKSYFRQRNGIPQGSVLSSILCNLFYAEMEREVLDFLLPEKSLLLRLVDDFLLITPDSALATRFLQVMIKGQPAYGVSVNPAKSLVNFAASVDGAYIPRLVDTSLFPYCGTLIDTRTLEIYKDHERSLEGGHSAAATLSDSLTVEVSRAPGRCFHRKVLTSFTLLMHPMYLDTTHNSLAVVLSNLYANFLTTAMRMYCYMRSLQGRTHPTPDIIVRTIRDLIRMTQRLVERAQERRERDDKSGETAAASAGAVHQSQVQYLAATAFRFVLGRKQTRYAGVLRWLEVVARQTRPASDRKRMQLTQVVNHGNLVYGEWKF